MRSLNVPRFGQPLPVISQGTWEMGNRRRDREQEVRALRPMQLRDLDVYATKLSADVVRELAAAWPGCRVRLPNGSVFTAD